MNEPIQSNDIKLENLPIQPVQAVKTKKVKERETWSGRFDFFLAALGYAGKY
jgi:hypothetical protein